MKLQTYIERSRILDLALIPEQHREELLGLLEEGIQLPELVEDNHHLVQNLPRAQLHRLFEARMEWRARARAVARLEEALGRSSLPMPPFEVRERALVPHKVDALERAARIVNREDFESDEAWSEALSALLDTWSGAVAQTLRRGIIKVTLRVDHPDAAEFEQIARRKEALSDLPTHRWQAVRRGERAGAVEVSFESPISTIRGHLEGILPRLGSTAGAREVDDLVDEMVLAVLPGYLRAILDARAEVEAIRSAVSQYQKLLTSAPHASGRVGALAITGDGKKLGVIVVSEGDIPELQEVLPTEDEEWPEKMESLFSVSGVEQVVVPVSSPAHEIHRVALSALEEGYELVKVRTAALSDARKMLVDPPLSLPPPVASALVLARRALQPSDEWERVDPVAIGLADYQQDLDEERLREAMLETLGLFQLDRSSGAFVPPRPRPSAKQTAAARTRLNPMVKSISDLRPGMSLEGIITNTTRFGAFVNIGLSEEGMIHISELSNEYVQAPTDVVAIGDRIQARVLDVDPHKRRIALSLKPDPSDHRPGDREPPSGDRREGGRNVPLDTRLRPGRSGGDRGRRDRRGGGPVGMGRSQALQQLENLFKK